MNDNQRMAQGMARKYESLLRSAKEELEAATSNEASEREVAFKKERVTVLEKALREWEMKSKPEEVEPEQEREKPKKKKKEE